MIPATVGWQDLLGADASPAAAWLAVLARLVGATLLGGLVSWLYRRSRRDEERQAGFDQTLVLLAPLIAMVTMAVGSNIAAAFTLVGTLAIVRFRTAIRDSRDTAFVIFAVAGGLAIGSNSLLVAGLGTAVVGGTVLVLRDRSTVDRSPLATLRVLLAPPDADLDALRAAVAALGGSLTIVRGGVDRKDGTLELRCRLRGVEPARFPALLAALLALPEVMRAHCASRDAGDDADGSEGGDGAAGAG